MDRNLRNSCTSFWHSLPYIQLGKNTGLTHTHAPWYNTTWTCWGIKVESMFQRNPAITKNQNQPTNQTKNPNNHFTKIWHGLKILNWKIFANEQLMDPSTSPAPYNPSSSITSLPNLQHPTNWKITPLFLQKKCQSQNKKILITKDYFLFKDPFTIYYKNWITVPSSLTTTWLSCFLVIQLQIQICKDYICLHKPATSNRSIFPIVFIEIFL